MRSSASRLQPRTQLLVLAVLLGTLVAARPEPAPPLAVASGCCIGPASVSVLGPDWRLRSVADGETGTLIERSGVTPAWSADGRRLTVSFAHLGRTRIASARVDGRGTSTIPTLPLTYVNSMDRAPNDGWIAVAGTHPCPTWGCIGTSEVLLVHPSGRPIIPLGPGNDVAWSPDGARLAFTSLGRLLIVDVGPTGPGSPVDVTPDGIGASAPAWSPDGTRIALHGYRGTVSSGAPDVWVVRSDGAASRRLPVKAWGPVTWSPDSRQLVWTGRGLHTIAADGRSPRRTVLADEALEGRAVWSPDGRWIAFSRWSESCCVQDLLLVHPDGRGLRDAGDVVGMPAVSFRRS